MNDKYNYYTNFSYNYPNIVVSYIYANKKRVLYKR